MQEDDFHLIDLTNYRNHPTRKDIRVFFFKEMKRADYFEQLLKEKSLFYEKFVEKEDKLKIYFGVKRTDFGVIKELNNLAIGKFRESFIPNKSFRKFLILGTALALAFVIAGAILSD